MAIVLNMMPLEQKQNTVSQSTNAKGSTKGNKSELGFAKALNAETGKNGIDVDSKVKSDDNVQLLATMAGMVLPAIVNVRPVDEVADNLETSALVQQTSDVMLEGVANSEKNTSSNLLTALLAEMTEVTEVTSQAGNIEISEFAKMQMQSNQVTGQIPMIDTSKKSTDVLNDNPFLLNSMSTLTVADNFNGLGKNTSKQSDGKKIPIGQVESNITESTNLAGTFSVAEVKPVLSSQVPVSVDDMLTSKNKEDISMLLGGQEQLDVDNFLPNQAVKDGDNFINILNHQGLRMEHQTGLAEIKHVPSQQLPDSYNINTQIVDQARLVEGQKNTEMIIRLKPEHLGELTFKVTVESGIISASFHSNNAEVRSIIESSLSQLKQELSNIGLKIDNVGVYAGLGQFFSNGQQSGNYQQPVIKVENKKNEEEFLDVLESTDPTDRIVDGIGVDYRA